MKNVISISEARRALPRMIKEIQKNPEAVFKITVRSETIAEIRSTGTMVAPGDAVRKLIQFRKKLSSSAKPKGRQPISRKIKDYLYPEANP